MKLLLFRPYYGITVNSDMQGDLGVSEYSSIVFPDLSLVYAATVANESSSIQLDVIDANAEKKLFADLEPRLWNEYDTIILKATAPTVKCDIELAKYLKNKYPQSKVIMAGHVSKLIKNWLIENAPEIDSIAEIPLEDYVYQLANNGDEHLHIDNLPSPNFKLFPYKNFIDGQDRLRGCLHFSRGCVIGCSYCPYASFYGKKFENRSIENVIKDIKQLLNLGITNIQFRDQFFTYDKQRVVELCNMIIEQNLKFNWTCETKIESLNTELIDIMVEAGMEMICFGVESASKSTLKSFNRPAYDVEKIKGLISYLNSKNVSTLAFYIIGFPEDAWETIGETYDLAMYLGSKYVKFSVYTPFISPENESVTPNSFVPFENTMSINSSKFLSAEEINYLANQLMVMYHSKFNGFKDAYYFHFLNQTNYRKTVAKLKREFDKNRLLNFSFN